MNSSSTSDVVNVINLGFTLLHAIFHVLAHFGYIRLQSTCCQGKCCTFEEEMHTKDVNKDVQTIHQ